MKRVQIQSDMVRARGEVFMSRAKSTTNISASSSPTVRSRQDNLSKSRLQQDA